MLAEHFPEWFIEIRGEGRQRSSYRFGPADRRVEFCFRVGAESCLPAALASMASKYLRELAMRAFNDFWRRHVPDLQPTAGYPQDAKRFRADIAEAMQALAHFRSDIVASEVIMDLYIVRHAWAFDRDDDRWPNDDLRPLTDEGKERFAKVVKTLAGRGMAPQVVATSPLVRCVQTAELLAAGVPEQAENLPARRVAAGRRRGGAVAMDRPAGPRARADRLGRPRPRRGPALRRAGGRAGRPDPFLEGRRGRHRVRRPPGPRRRRASLAGDGEGAGMLTEAAVRERSHRIAVLRSRFTHPYIEDDVPATATATTS